MNIPPTEADWANTLMDRLHGDYGWKYTLSGPGSEFLELDIDMPLSPGYHALYDPATAWIDLWGLLFDYLYELEMTRIRFRRAGAAFARHLDLVIFNALCGESRVPFAGELPPAPPANTATSVPVESPEAFLDRIGREQIRQLESLGLDPWKNPYR